MWVVNDAVTILCDGAIQICDENVVIELLEPLIIIYIYYNMHWCFLLVFYLPIKLVFCLTQGYIAGR